MLLFVKNGFCESLSLPKVKLTFGFGWFEYWAFGPGVVKPKSTGFWVWGFDWVSFCWLLVLDWVWFWVEFWDGFWEEFWGGFWGGYWGGFCGGYWGGYCGGYGYWYGYGYGFGGLA